MIIDIIINTIFTILAIITSIGYSWIYLTKLKQDPSINTDHIVCKILKYIMIILGVILWYCIFDLWAVIL